MRRVVTGDVASPIAARRGTFELVRSPLSLVQIWEDRWWGSWHSDCRGRSTGRGENIFGLVSMKRQCSLPKHTNVSWPALPRISQFGRDEKGGWYWLFMVLSQILHGNPLEHIQLNMRTFHRYDKQNRLFYCLQKGAATNLLHTICNKRIKDILKLSQALCNVLLISSALSF